MDLQIKGMAQTFSSGFSRKPTRKRAKENRKELGWEAYVKPISKFNESVHKSKCIGFDKI